LFATWVVFPGIYPQCYKTNSAKALEQQNGIRLKSCKSTENYASSRFPRENSAACPYLTTVDQN